MLPEPAKYLAPDALDHLIFKTTVPEDHYLRQVRAVIDFERFRADMVSCYSANLGRPATEPLLLLKLEFLQYQYNLGDQSVVEQARYNMAFRYFLNLSLKSPLPHDTLLTKFRNRLGVEKHQQIFEDVVAQARAHGLVKDRLRLKDATHVIANIAIPSAVRLVAETRQQLLDALRPYQPERVALEEERAATIHKATADLSGEERLLQRVTHLRDIVTWIEESIALGSLSPSTEPVWQALQEALQIAHKVLADRENPNSKDRLVTLQDPDARWGEHHVHYAGYLLDVAEDADSGIITALNVLPANGDEARDATTLIAQEERAHGNDVGALSMDGAGSKGELLREWTDPQGLNLDVIVPPRPRPAANEYFGVERFTLTPDGEAFPRGRRKEPYSLTGCGKRVLVAIVVMKSTANLKAVMLLAHCTECDHSYHVSDELAECHVKCPECYSTVHVPKRDGPTSKRSDLSSAKLGPASSRWRIVSGLAWLWLARLTCGGAFAALMVYEWNCWPNGSPLLGPLGIIWYNGFGAESLVLCAISLAMVFAFLFKPHAITAAISLLGGLNWLFWGVVGAGIGC